MHSVLTSNQWMKWMQFVYPYKPTQRAEDDWNQGWKLELRLFSFLNKISLNHKITINWNPGPKIWRKSSKKILFVNFLFQTGTFSLWEHSDTIANDFWAFIERQKPCLYYWCVQFLWKHYNEERQANKAEEGDIIGFLFIKKLLRFQILVLWDF